MEILFFIALIILVAFGFAAFKSRETSIASEKRWPFYAKKPLTQPEQVLYHRLVRAMPECIVLAQVQLSRVLGVKKGFDFRVWNNRINRLSLDFLICLKDSTIVSAIELDDKTHNNPLRIEADTRKEKALFAAGIVLVRWNVGALPDEATIRQVLAK